MKCTMVAIFICAITSCSLTATKNTAKSDHIDSTETPQGLEESVLIKNVNVVDVVSGKVMFKKNILIVRNIIKKISDVQISASKKTKLIDASGKFLIPGLIDSHVHLGKVPGMSGGHKKKYPDLVRAYQRQQPRSYLYYGFTTLIDLNVFAPGLIAKFRDQPLHPDVFTCSRNLDIANGHGMFEEDTKDRLKNNPNFLYDHYQKQFLNEKFDLALHTPKATVKRIKDDNGICIKTYYENGYGGSEMVDYDIPSIEIIRDVVKEGHKIGLPTILHANSWESYRFALQSKVDIIGHGLWHWGEYRHSIEVPNSIRKTLKEIADRGIGYQPTLHVLASQMNLFEKDYLNQPDLRNAYPPELLEWYKSEEGKWFRANIKKYMPTHLRDLKSEEYRHLFTTYYDHAGKSLAVLSDYKANLLLGTDTIVGQSFANAPGLSGFEEIQAWNKYGVPLAKILHAATIGNARAFKIEDRYGTIDEGKIANLLLLSEDPLQSVDAYNKIDLVFLRGTPIKRLSLSASHLGN